MRNYYWESKISHGMFRAGDDNVAKAKASTISGLLICYRESNNENGLPFVVILEG